MSDNPFDILEEGVGEEKPKKRRRKQGKKGEKGKGRKKKKKRGKKRKGIKIDIPGLDTNGLSSEQLVNNLQMSMKKESAQYDSQRLTFVKTVCECHKIIKSQKLEVESLKRKLEIANAGLMPFLAHEKIIQEKQDKRVKSILDQNFKLEKEQERLKYVYWKKMEMLEEKLEHARIRNKKLQKIRKRARERMNRYASEIENCRRCQEIIKDRTIKIKQMKKLQEERGDVKLREQSLDLQKVFDSQIEQKVWKLVDDFTCGIMGNSQECKRRISILMDNQSELIEIVRKYEEKLWVNSEKSHKTRNEYRKLKSENREMRAKMFDIRELHGNITFQNLAKLKNDIDETKKTREKNQELISVQQQTISRLSDTLNEYQKEITNFPDPESFVKKNSKLFEVFKQIRKKLSIFHNLRPKPKKKKNRVHVFTREERGRKKFTSDINEILQDPKERETVLRHFCNQFQDFKKDGMKKI